MPCKATLVKHSNIILYPLKLKLNPTFTARYKQLFTDAHQKPLVSTRVYHLLIQLRCESREHILNHVLHMCVITDYQRVPLCHHILTRRLITASSRFVLTEDFCR